MTMQFNVADINQRKLEQRAFAEADLIYAKSGPRRDRDLATIRDDCIVGQRAEVYLMDMCGFSDDPRAYKDVKDPSGEPIEVKTTRRIQNISYVVERANAAAKKEYNKNFQKRLYIFIFNEYNGNYTLHSTYTWNGKQYINDQ